MLAKSQHVTETVRAKSTDPAAPLRWRAPSCQGLQHARQCMRLQLPLVLSLLLHLTHPPVARAQVGSNRPPLCTNGTRYVVNNMKDPACCDLNEYPVLHRLAERTSDRFSTDNLLQQLVTLEPARLAFEAEAVATRPQFVNPMNVYVKLVVKRIYSVDQLSQRFTMVLELFQRWRDCRLIYARGPPGGVTVTQDSPHFSQIWKPSVSFEEEVFTDDTSTRSLLIIEGDGSVLQRSAMSRSFTCSFNFADLPWDTQNCNIHLMVPEYTTDGVQLLWDPKEPLVVEELGNREWRFASQKDWTDTLESTSIQSLQPGPERFISSLSFSFLMERKAHDYVLNYVAPTLVYWLCSYGSFYVDPGAVPARVTLGLVPILTLNNKMGQLRSSLPPINEAFRLENFMFLCFILMICHFLEYCVVNYFKRVRTMTKDLPGPTDPEASQATRVAEASWRWWRPRVNRCASRWQSNLDVHSRWLFPLVLLSGMMIILL